MFAGVSLYIADNFPWAENYIIANDLRQADERVGKYARRAIALSPYLSERFRTRGYQIRHKFNGSVIESIPIDPSGEAGSNADLIQFSELWGAMEEAKARMWCFDKETEILTRRGWLKYNQLTMDDKIATVKQVTHELEWQKPTGIFKNRYEGKMHYYGGKRFSKCVTPNHRLYGIFSYNSKGNKYAHEGIMESEELRQSGYRVYFPLICPESYPHHNYEKKTFKSTKFKDSYDISWSDWCAFMGIYLSDGYTSKHNISGQPVSVKVTQSKKKNGEKWELIKELFDFAFEKVGYRLYEYKGDRKGSYDFVISSSPLAEYLYPLGNSYTKHIPAEIKDSSPEHLQTFLDWYIMGDGHRVSKTSWSITTGSKQMVDDLQEIALKLGYYASASQNATGNNWRVRISNGKEGYAKELDKRRGWHEVDYTGVIWCPSVPNGLMITRRNNKPCISGNSEMTLSPTKFGRSFRMVESYAGYVEESELLYDLWELGTQKGVRIWPDKKYAVYGGKPGEITEYTPLEIYKNEEARLLCLWNTQPRCPWQTSEYYAQETAMLHPLEFDRMHRNQWVTQTDTFCPMEWYDSCQRPDEDWPEIPENWPMALTADAGTRKDNFGVLMTCRHPDREKYPHAVLIIYAKKWIPPAGARGLDYIGTEENPGPEMELRRLIDENNVVVLAYDDHQLHDMMNRFRREHIVFCRRFPQGSGKHSRTISDGALYDKIRERKIWHRGEPELRQHVQNANAKIDDQERRLRIVKRTKKLKVDLCVCLSMGAYEIHRLVV